MTEILKSQGLIYNVEEQEKSSSDSDEEKDEFKSDGSFEGNYEIKNPNDGKMRQTLDEVLMTRMSIDPKDSMSKRVSNSIQAL